MLSSILSNFLLFVKLSSLNQEVTTNLQLMMQDASLTFLPKSWHSNLQKEINHLKILALILSK